MKIHNPDDFETVIELFFKRKGCETVRPPKNNKAYDIEVLRAGRRVAVQCKNRTSSTINSTVLKKLIKFHELNKDKFEEIWCLTNTNYAMAALTWVQSDKPKNIRLGIFHLHPEKIYWVYPESKSVL